MQLRRPIRPLSEHLRELGLSEQDMLRMGAGPDAMGFDAGSSDRIMDNPGDSKGAASHPELTDPRCPPGFEVGPDGTCVRNGMAPSDPGMTPGQNPGASATDRVMDLGMPTQMGRHAGMGKDPRMGNSSHEMESRRFGRTPTLSEAGETLDKIMKKVSNGEALTPEEEEILAAAIDASRGKDESMGIDRILRKIKNGQPVSEIEEDRLARHIGQGRGYRDRVYESRSRGGCGCEDDALESVERIMEDIHDLVDGMNGRPSGPTKQEQLVRIYGNVQAIAENILKRGFRNPADPLKGVFESIAFDARTIRNHLAAGNLEESTAEHDVRQIVADLIDASERIADDLDEDIQLAFGRFGR